MGVAMLATGRQREANFMTETQTNDNAPNPAEAGVLHNAVEINQLAADMELALYVTMQQRSAGLNMHERANALILTLIRMVTPENWEAFIENLQNCNQARNSDLLRKALAPEDHDALKEALKIATEAYNGDGREAQP